MSFPLPGPRTAVFWHFGTFYIFLLKTFRVGPDEIFDRKRGGELVIASGAPQTLQHFLLKTINILKSVIPQ